MPGKIKVLKRSRTRKTSPKKRRKSRSLKRKKDGLGEGFWEYLGYKPEPENNIDIRLDEALYNNIIEGASTYLINILLEQKTDLNELVYKGNIIVPLILAASYNRLDIVKLFLRKRDEDGKIIVDINKKNTDGKSALDIACEYKYPEMIKLLKENGAVLDKGKTCYQPGVEIKRETRKKQPEPESDSDSDYESTKSPGIKDITGSSGESVGVLYKTYFDLIKRGIPKPAVQAKLVSANLNPAILDMDTEKPLPADFITDYKLSQSSKPKKEIKRKLFHIDTISECGFWEKKSEYIDNIFSPELNKLFTESYITKGDNSIKKIVDPVNKVKGISELLDIDVKYKQNIIIGYKKIVSTIPVNVTLKPYEYVTNLLTGKYVITPNDELILSVLNDIIPHKSEEATYEDSNKKKIAYTKVVADATQIDKILKISSDNLKKLNSGDVLPYEFFIYNILKISNQYERIQSLLFENIFTKTEESLNNQINIIGDAFKVLKDSTNFQSILKFIQKLLSLGGHTGGFSLTKLSEILDFKSKTGTGKTILNFVIEVLKSRGFDFKSLFDYMEPVNKAIKFSIRDIEKNIEESKANSLVVAKVTELNGNYENYEIISKKISMIVEKIADIKGKYIEMLNLYCEPDENPDVSTFLLSVNVAIVKMQNEWVKTDIRKL